MKNFTKRYFFYLKRIFTNWEDLRFYETSSHGNFLNLFATAFYALGKDFTYLFFRVAVILIFPVTPLILILVENRNKEYEKEIKRQIDEDL